MRPRGRFVINLIHTRAANSGVAIRGSANFWRA